MGCNRVASVDKIAPILERRLKKQREIRIELMLKAKAEDVSEDSVDILLGAPVVEEEESVVYNEDFLPTAVTMETAVTEIPENEEVEKEILEEVVENTLIDEEGFNFKNLRKTKVKPFDVRLHALRADVYIRYDVVYKYLTANASLKEVKSKTSKTFKFKNKTIAKITIKGKSIFVYIALNPQDLVDTKYIFTDASEIKKYANYPTCVKLTSKRQAKWVCELVDRAIFSKGVEL